MRRLEGKEHRIRGLLSRVTIGMDEVTRLCLSLCMGMEMCEINLQALWGSGTSI